MPQAKKPLADRKRVAVIGAGPAGLATIKELLEYDCDVVAFEMQATIGGLFASSYEGLLLTSSSVITSFGSFSDGRESTPTMWTCQEYLSYLHDYASHFDLFKCIYFGAKVERVWQDPQTGRVRVRAVPVRVGAPSLDEPGLMPPTSRGVLGEEGFEDEFDHVAVCCGLNMHPDTPTWPGIERFRGRVMHSTELRNAREFAGKSVVVVGLGESGSDLALQAAMHSRASAVSARTGPGYVVPRYFGGRPLDLDTTRCHHAIPRNLMNTPLFGIKRSIEQLFVGRDDDPKVLKMAAEMNRKRGRAALSRFGTKNTSFVEAIAYHGTAYKPDIKCVEEERVVFTDGTSMECDVIVCCTGFKVEFPFLDPDLAARVRNPRKLYKRMILPDLGPAIGWIGFMRPGFGSIPPGAEMQARYWALLVSGERSLPDQATMQADIAHHDRLDHQQYPDDASRIVGLTDFLRFMDSMAEVIGCVPPLRELAIRDPRTWAKVIFGPLTAVQFRLTGPGAEPGRAREVLARTPTMPWPILAYEFAMVVGSKIAYDIGAGEQWKPVGVWPG